MMQHLVLGLITAEWFWKWGEVALVFFWVSASNILLPLILALAARV